MSEQKPIKAPAATESEASSTPPAAPPAAAPSTPSEAPAPASAETAEVPRRRTHETIVMGLDDVPEESAAPAIPADVPTPVTPPAATDGSTEPLAFMPDPTDIPPGSPEDPAPAPGRVPPGDSRSLRRGSDFALVYRRGSSVISRFGVIGQRGQWRVVDYPTSAMASGSYAKEVSRFVGDGFSDYRD